jgi:hypothetical protein
MAIGINGGNGLTTQSTFNVTPAYSGNFIPTLWSGKLNAKFYVSTVFGEIANTGYEGEIKSMGDKIVINNIPTITIQTYTVGTNLTYEVPAPQTVELLIDKAKYFGVTVNDVLAVQSKPSLMSMFTDDASMQMKIAIDRDVMLAEFNNGASANKGATAGAISGAFNLGTDSAPVALDGNSVLPLITALSTVLDEQNVPETDRFLVIPGTFRQVLMQSPLAQAYVTGDSQSPLRNGKIGRIDRFDIYVSNQLPKAALDKNFAGATQTGAKKRTAVMAGHKTALTFASQITKTESLQNPNDFGTLVRGLNVYGHKMIKPEAWALALVA